MIVMSPFAIDSDNYHDNKVALYCWKSAFYVPANFIGNTELVLAPSIIIISTYCCSRSFVLKLFAKSFRICFFMHISCTKIACVQCFKSSPSEN